jgi:hypothetical protein
MLHQVMRQAAVSDPEKQSWTVAQWKSWFFDNVTSSRYNVIDSAQLLAWSVENNRYKKIEDVTLNRDHPLYSVCKVAMTMLERESSVLDLNIVGRRMMLEALLQGQVIDQNDYNALYALATIVQPRYLELGCSEPHDGDIGAWTYTEA